MTALNELEVAVWRRGHVSARVVAGMSHVALSGAVLVLDPQNYSEILAISVLQVQPLLGLIGR